MKSKSIRIVGAIPALALAFLSLAASGAHAADEFWAQATFVKGNVGVKPAAGAEIPALSLGTVLHKGDRVAAAEGSSASFLLNDGSILVVRGGNEAVLGNGSKAGGPKLEAVAKNLSKTLLSREGNNPMLKHLGGLRGASRNLALAPSRTKVRSGGVQLVWLRNPGSKRYQVTVMGPADTLFESTVAGTSFDLPAEKVTGAGTYYWEIRDADLKDSMSSLGSGSFVKLDKGAEDEIRTIEERISTAFPAGAANDDSTPLFLSYQIYREHGLNLDALRTLQKMITLHPDDAELLRWRKEMCKDLGLEEQDLALITAS